MTPEQYKKLDELIDKAYTKIGIDISRREQLVFDVNHVLQITRDEPMISRSVGISAIQLAQSDYFASPLRQPTLLAAAHGGAFVPETRSFILSSSVLAKCSIDIRDTKAILEKILRTKFPEEKKPLLLLAIREIVSLGTICRALPDREFDSRLRMINKFKSVGFKATVAAALADLAQESPELAAAFEKMMINRRINAATKNATA